MYADQQAQDKTTHTITPTPLNLEKIGDKNSDKYHG